MYRMTLITHKSIELIDITNQVQELVTTSGVKSGAVLVYIPHTTAGITINENADRDVREDLGKAFRMISPRRNDYQHREGNSPAHLLATVIGSEKMFIVEDGRLCLGTWQGIYFCEFDGPRKREIWVKVMATPAVV